MANRRFIVDEVLNTVVALCTFGAVGPTVAAVRLTSTCSVSRTASCATCTR